MLYLPTGASEHAVVMGIDPGSDTLGVSFIYYNVRTSRIDKTVAMTLRGSRMISGSPIVDIHGVRATRIHMLSERLYALMCEYNPMVVVSESPFFAVRMPQAYGALTEVVCAIRNALWRYDWTMVLELIDPPRVKQAVGAAGNADKFAVSAALQERYHLLNYDAAKSGLVFSALDEHSIDAIAVAYSRINTFR